MAAKDGDGWLDCTCGHKHWGRHGAAGLLLVRNGTVLLQHRAPWVHNGDTWGIPGGARDSHESIFEAAKREAEEELGITTNLLEPLGTFTDDHGIWRYDTVIVQASQDLVAHEMNDESQQVEWVTLEAVSEKHLHPALARDWPKLYALITELFI
jgi:8-oxo-dGTP diphosphatase